MARKATARASAQSTTTGLERALSFFPDAQPAGAGHWQARCQAHGDEKPSLTISLVEDKKRAGYMRLVIKCHAGCTGDEVREAHGFDDWDALRFPSEEARGAAVSAARPAAAGVQHSPDYDTGVVRRDHAALTFSLDGMAYATKTRGLSRDVIARRMIGYHGGEPQHAGLAIPRFRDGAPTYRKVRLIDPPKGVSKMTRYPSGVESHLYNIDDLVADGITIVTEGEIDALSLETAGVGADIDGFAIVSIPDGVDSAHAPATVEPLRNQSRVYIAMDADEPGEKAAKKLAAALRPVPCFRLTFPRYKDANAALVALGREKFRALVEEQMAAEVPVGTAPPEREAPDATSTTTEDATSNETPEDADDADAELSDLGNGLRFVRAAEGAFYFVGLWDKWLAWDGRRWSRDTGRRVYELAARVARSIHGEAALVEDRDRQDAIVKHALQSQRKERIEAMVALAGRAYPDLKAAPERFDTDPFLLNVESGTIDLRTGDLKPHDTGDLLTKLAPVRYDPDACAPRWERFLTEVLPDAKTRAFTQRVAGYMLTGDVREEALVFLYGTGRNGKGVLLNMLHALLGGEYAIAAPPNLLMSRKMESHPTELATLAGRRLVSAVETGKGKAWDEARVKWLTGGDPISARGMREDFWEFKPTFKLVVASNYQPRVVGTDPGIWSRIKMIPFEQEFRDADDADPGRRHLPVRDNTLKQRLLAELPGILNWAIEGCVAWQRDGLGEPTAVREAVRAYRMQEDTLRPFIGAHPIPAAGVLLETLGDRYRGYAREHSEREMDNRTLAAALRERGYRVEPAAKNKRKVYPPASGAAVAHIAHDPDVDDIQVDDTDNDDRYSDDAAEAPAPRRSVKKLKFL